MYDGLLLVDKPVGISSFGVVARVRGILTREMRSQHEERGYCHEIQQPNSGHCRCKIKVGHTGTLDPAATGLLVLAIGTYTKKVPQLIKQDKTYQVTMVLGKTSTTGDREGELTLVSPAVPSLQQVQDALSAYTGELMQTPPIFSAIKVNGQRAYDLARKGKPVELEPRKVIIYSNELSQYTYPEVWFVSSVSSGTYIRSLVEDLGKTLGTGAYMSALRRTRIGSLAIESALLLDNLDEPTIKQNLIS